MRRRRPPWRGLAIVAILAAWWAVTAGPATAGRDPLMLGHWKLWTELALDFQVRNNLHLAHDHDITKALYLLRPSLHLRRDFWAASYLSLDYNAMVAVKEDSSPLGDQFSNDDWWSNAFDLQARAGGFTGWYVKARSIMQRTSDRRGSDNLYRLGLKTSRRYWRVLMSAGYTFGLSSRLEATVGYLAREYDAPEADKHNQKGYDGLLTYERRLRGPLWFVGRYLLETRDYLDQDGGEQEDFCQHSLLAGVRWEPGGVISGRALIGCAWRAYRDPVNEDRVDMEDGANWVARVYLDLNPRPGTLVRLDFTRGLLAAPFGGLDYNFVVGNRLCAELRQAIEHGVEVFGAMAVGRWDYNPLADSGSLNDQFLEAALGLSCQLGNGMFMRAVWLLDHRSAGRDDMSYIDMRYTLTIGWRI